MTISPEHILTIDIGGSSIKAGLVRADGFMLSALYRYSTPSDPSPARMLDAMLELANPFSGFNAVSVGFPGAIKHHIIQTAPNLGTPLWSGVDFSALVEARFQCPVRLANDATMYGLGVITGKGIEVVLTLGTGMGFALFRDGIPAPQIELGQHTAGDEPSYDDFVGDAALRRIGETGWKQRVQQTIQRLAALVDFDKLHIGGGNARLFVQTELPTNVMLVTNEAGLAGGAKLWNQDIAFIFGYETKPIIPGGVDAERYAQGSVKAAMRQIKE